MHRQQRRQQKQINIKTTTATTINKINNNNNNNSNNNNNKKTGQRQLQRTEPVGHELNYDPRPNFCCNFLQAVTAQTPTGYANLGTYNLIGLNENLYAILLDTKILIKKFDWKLK